MFELGHKNMLINPTQLNSGDFFLLSFKRTCPIYYFKEVWGIFKEQENYVEEENTVWIFKFYDLRDPSKIFYQECTLFLEEVCCFQLKRTNPLIKNFFTPEIVAKYLTNNDPFLREIVKTFL